MIEMLKPYAKYKESGSSLLTHLRKSAESVDKISVDDPQIAQIRTDLPTGGQT